MLSTIETSTEVLLLVTLESRAASSGAADVIVTCHAAEHQRNV